MARLRKLDLGRAAILVVLVIGTVAILTRDQWDWLLQDGDAQTTGAEAPELTDVDEATERLYRISPDDGSSVTYRVAENVAGSDGVAEGVTTVLAGDIAVNLVDPDASRIGKIVVNIEMFESDSNLRDKRIRHDFLESTHYPFATFEATEVEGIPTEISDGTSSDLTITGDLTIKETTAPVTFTGSATLDADTLRAAMSTVVLMSTYDIGPIHVPALAHTEDEVELAFELVARRVDPDSTADDSELDVVPVAALPTGGSFAETVQPILERSCAYCHSSGGPGFSTVELDTAGQAAEIAQDIALVTGAGFMPPWPASPLSVEFQHDYSLPPDEVAAIATWAADGGGLDVPPDTPLVPRAQPFEDIDRDQVLPPASGPYVGSLDLKDDYRCQIHDVDDPEGDGTWVTGISFEPDELEVVHHSIIYRVPASQRENAESRDGADGRPGWTCFGRSGLGANALSDPSGVYSIGGWAPGQQPRVYPDGVGLYLQPGDFIVNQIHYHFDHTTPPDASVLVLDTMSSEEVAERESAGEPMVSPAGHTFLTPAEGPCPPEEQDAPLCDRDAVLADIASKYGIEARFIPDALLGGCEGDLEDFAQLEGTVFRSVCDQRFPHSGTLSSVLGHMHEFGAAYRMTLHPDTPEEIVLLDIPTWSFEWQLYYEPAEEIRIDQGDVFRIECVWDRSLVHLEEPRYITWNEGTVDEMCFSTAQVIPDRD